MPEELTPYEAENAVISILIKNPELVFDVTVLKSIMFSSIVHKELYDLIQRIATSGHIPDRSLIEIQIQENPELMDQVDIQFLNYVLGYDYNPNNLNEYIDIVVKTYKTRELVALATSLPNRAIGAENIETILTDTRYELDRITDVTGGGGTSSLEDLIPKAKQNIENRKDNPNYVKVTTGYSILDELTGGWKGGLVTIIASRPSVGKTAIMCNSAYNSAKEGSRVMLFEHEMSKQDLVDRLLAIATGIELLKIRTGNLTDTDYELILKTLDEFKKLPIYIDTSFGLGITYMRSTIKRYVKMYDIDVVFLDYIQLMVERTDSMTMELGNVSRELKVLATQLDIHIVILSQLNREAEKSEDKRPNLAHLRQSGNLEEDADMVAMLFRQDMYDKQVPANFIADLEFIIRKHRNGPVVTIPMKMNLVNNIIAEGM
jgi:replicative DNA helicase